MTALDDVLASITLDNADAIAAALLDRVTTVRKTAALDDAALRAQIGPGPRRSGRPLLRPPLTRPRLPRSQTPRQPPRRP